MNKIKKLLTTFVLISSAFQVIAKDVPSSFADLAEKLMPSVVNISTTTTIVTNTNPFPGFKFPPGSPFEDMFKEFGEPKKRKSVSRTTHNRLGTIRGKIRIGKSIPFPCKVVVIAVNKVPNELNPIIKKRI